jgi:restriction system protein
MPKRGYWAQVQRDTERERVQRERAYRALIRERERAARAAERERVLEEKERARLYAEARAAEVDEMNEDLDAQLEALEGVLAATLPVDDYIDFEELKRRPDLPAFDTGLLSRPAKHPVLDLPPAPSAMAKILPGAKRKHAEAVAAAEAEHHAALARYEEAENKRAAAIETAKADHQRRVAEIQAEAEAANREVDEFRAAFEAGDPAAVVDYFGLVLTASRYPDGFPKTHKLAFVPESKQLVLEYDLPRLDVVPDVRQYRYVKAKDDVTSATRPHKERRALYARAVSQTTLRCIHELFEADRSGHVDTIVFNGYVDTIDPRTGRPTRPCLVTVRTTRDAFMELDLGHVEPQACLKGLNAAVSKDPAELAPVRPVLEFNMVDARFVEEDQVLATLDQRPNLMELTPGEFESLITNLFERMGLETRMTQASRDGGVDCVAFDPRPIFGGKVVIQAKRYKHTVGVSAVRDLFGTMQNEGASKGILVTTSGYGKASFEFAEGKPLELLSGTNLLYLLQEHAGIEARIEPPEDWTDPIDGDAPPTPRVEAV